MSNRKIPLLTKRISINKNIKKNIFQNDNDYVQIGSLTPRFNDLYSKYIKSKQTTLYPNISYILKAYRAEKLNKLSEQEAMREEIGEEIRKYKSIHDILKKGGPLIDKRKYYNTFKNRNTRLFKENKGIILDTFQQYEDDKKTKNKINNEKYLTSLSPYKIFKRNTNSLDEKIKNKYKNKTSTSFNKNKMIELLNIKLKKKPKTRNGKKIIKLRDYFDFCHKKINSYCDKINDDTIKVKINGRKTVEKFNNSWNKCRIMQKFKYPQTKKHIFEDINI